MYYVYYFPIAFYLSNYAVSVSEQFVNGTSAHKWPFSAIQLCSQTSLSAVNNDDDVSGMNNTSL